MSDERENLRTCVECGRAPFPDEDPEEYWCARSDGRGELHMFCPGCAEREFGY